MTLYRQLLITMLGLFAILFVSAYWVQFQSTRDFLAEQLRTTVESTANSAGLALTPYLETADKVGAESVINAAFDGGYYRRIRLDLLASGEHLEKENTITLHDVPDWFIGLHLFDSVNYETVLTSGWLQLGKLEVEGHPGQAYFELWRGMSRLLVAFLVAFLVVTVLLMRALSLLLRPLEQIRHQAKEIEQHHFGHSIPLPRTLELRQVVQAINGMAAKLAKQFKEQAEAAERLRERAFRDAVSGLGNRAYFIGQVNSWIAEAGHGSLMLVAVDMLEDIYRDEGYAARDRMVAAVAKSIQACLQRFEGAACARISATEYAILLPGIEGAQLQEVGEEINRTIAELVINPIAQNQSISVIGMTVREEKDDLSTLLTKADNALRRARTERLGAVVLEQVSRDTLGRIAWKEIIARALQQTNLQFKSQPAILLESGQAHHEELFALIAQEDQLFSAGQFMPAVEQFELGAEFDKAVLQAVAPSLYRSPDKRLAINLTMGSITSDPFHFWLADYLLEHEHLAGRLLFELPETAIVYARQSVDKLVGLLKARQFTWGVDQYGRYFQSLGYLESLMPAYVKVDHGYTSMVLKEEGDQAFLSAVCRAAHNAGIVTIATRVEDAAQVKALAELFVDGYQGYISPPQPFV